MLNCWEEIGFELLKPKSNKMINFNYFCNNQAIHAGPLNMD